MTRSFLSVVLVHTKYNSLLLLNEVLSCFFYLSTYVDCKASQVPRSWLYLSSSLHTCYCCWWVSRNIIAITKTILYNCKPLEENDKASNPIIHFFSVVQDSFKWLCDHFSQIKVNITVEPHVAMSFLGYYYPEVVHWITIIASTVSAS